MEVSLQLSHLVQQCALAKTPQSSDPFTAWFAQVRVRAEALLDSAEALRPCLQHLRLLRILLLKKGVFMLSFIIKAKAEAPPFGGPRP
jgi:hypothetical protein